jgi:hypothetical protein
MRPYIAKINIKDESGNEREVVAECVDVYSNDLGQPPSYQGRSVKKVIIDGHTVTVGVDGSFYHPDTSVLYTV